jgi:signal transduction histidine kinase
VSASLDTAATTRAQAGAAGLRRIANRSATETGGGFALVFARARADGPIALRAAAGFESADRAKHAAAAILRAIGNAADRESAWELEGVDLGPGELADRAQSLIAFPCWEADRVVGVLVAGSPAARTPRERQALELCAETLRLELVSTELRGEVDRLRQQIERSAAESVLKSEEVLELSEALFAQDIELLRNNEKLGKIEKLKNDFIEKMSRELRTPLNGIIEAIISVLTGEDDALSDAAKQTLRSALDDGTAFLRTLQNILDLWRIKQGELPVEIQEVRFREVIEEAIFSVQDAIGKKPLVIEPRLGEPFPKIRTDLTKLNQILFLLLDNAVKFTPRGQIEIRAEVRDARLYCEVRDTGIGICADDQQFIFDDFFQVDDGTGGGHHGAGLGLALVRDLIVLLDGSISVSSEVGQGTSMSFEIPVQPVN